VLLYKKIFFADAVKFQDPPTSLLFLDLLQRASGSSWERVQDIANTACWFCVPLIGVLSSLLLIGSVRAAAGDPAATVPRNDYLRFAALGIGASLAFYPITRSYYPGQIQTPMTVLAAAALLAWQRGRRGLAGVLLGVCTGIKPQWGVILLGAA
jgi:alpha-1,2-mannosyltransferase